MIERQLCKTAFDEVLHALHTDRAVRVAAQRLRSQCRDDRAARERGECTVDEAFESLLANPTHQVNHILEVALDNLWAAEHKIMNDGSQKTQLSAWVELAHAYYRGENEDVRRGIEINPSSARLQGGDMTSVLGSVAALLLPNYISLYGYVPSRRSDLARDVDARRRSGGVALGWHPLVWYNASPVEVVTALEGFIYKAEAPSEDQGITMSPGLLLRTRALGSGTTLEVGAFYSKHQFDVITPSGQESGPILNVGVGFLGNRLKATFRKRNGRPAVVNLGVGDVNGLLYWWWFR